MPAINVAIIGLDTSHSIQFAKRMNDPECPEDQRVSGLKAITCQRFETPFQDKKGLDERQQELEGWGVKVTEDFDEAIKGCDAIMLEINDPAPHWEYFQKVAGLGKPVFLDKPLAGTLEDGKRIVDLARKKGVKAWSASSLRYLDSLVEARQEAGEPVLCNVYGALGKASAGSDLVWYGIHTVEMMAAIMGRGAKSVFARRDAKGIVLTVEFADGRRAVLECNENAWFYGGRVQSADQIRLFNTKSDPRLYYNLLCKVRDFFVDGTVPVPLEETLEIQAVLDAGERSLHSGKEEGVKA